MSDQQQQWSHESATKLIREIISDLAPVPSELVPDARLVEELGYHSLSLLELAFSLEDDFDLPTIDEPTARQIITVGDVERHVLDHLRSVERLD